MGYMSAKGVAALACSKALAVGVAALCVKMSTRTGIVAAVRGVARWLTHALAMPENSIPFYSRKALSLALVCVVACTNTKENTPLTSTDAFGAWADVQGPVPEDVERQLVHLAFSNGLRQRSDAQALVAAVDGFMTAHGLPQSASVDISQLWLKDVGVSLKNGALRTSEWSAIAKLDYKTAFRDARILLAFGSATNVSAALGAPLESSRAFADALRNFAQTQKEALGATSADLTPSAPRPGEVLPMFIDGGNVVSARKADASAVVFIGEHLLIAATLLLHKAKVFDATSPWTAELNAARVRLFNLSSADFSKREQDTAQRFSVGISFLNLLAATKNTPNALTNMRSLLGLASTASDLRVQTDFDAYRRRSILYVADSSQDAIGARVTRLRDEFMVYEEAARALMAQWLELPEDRLVVLRNLLYHLDLYIKPARPGAIMMPHPEHTGQLIRDEASINTSGSTQSILEGTAQAIKAQGLNTVYFKDALASVSQDGSNSRINYSFFQGIMGSVLAPSACSQRANPFFLVHSSGEPVRDQQFAQELKRTLKIQAYFLPPYAETDALSNAGVDCAAYPIVAPLR